MLNLGTEVLVCNPSAGVGGRRMRHKKVDPGSYWPASPAKLVRFRFNERIGIKKLDTM